MKAAMLKGLVPLLSVVVLNLAAAADEVSDKNKTFYFQIVRGSDTDTAPMRGAKPIGPKLRNRLEHIFRWKNYWEVDRGKFEVEHGKISKIRISDERRLEVSFVGTNELEVRLFRDGKLVRKNRYSRSVKFTLDGGDEVAAQSWFIILRTDKPSTA